MHIQAIKRMFSRDKALKREFNLIFHEIRILERLSPFSDDRGGGFVGFSKAEQTVAVLVHAIYRAEEALRLGIDAEQHGAPGAVGVRFRAHAAQMPDCANGQPVTAAQIEDHVYRVLYLIQPQRRAPNVLMEIVPVPAPFGDEAHNCFIVIVPAEAERHR